MESLTRDHPNPHNIETAYRLAEEDGVKVPYMVGHLKYKQCASDVDDAQGYSPMSQTEKEYARCAYQSALRTNILLRIDKNVSLADAKLQLPANYSPLVTEFYDMAEHNGVVAALEESATRLDSCIRNATDN